MNDPAFELVLDQALQLRAAGSSVEACLARFPQYAAELRPLLETAAHAAGGLRAGEPLPPPDLARGRARVLHAARASQPRPATIVLRWATALAFVLALAFGVSAASARSLPGDVVYPVKRALEGVQLALTSNLTVRRQLEAEHNARRQEEVRALSQMKREGVVEFEGPVESATAEEIVIAGVRIRGAGAAQAGERVRVSVRTTREGVIVLEALTPIGAPAPPERPTSPPPPTSTPAPPTATVVREATATVEPTPARPTQTASPAPTATAPPVREPTREPPTAARATDAPPARLTDPPPTPTPTTGRERP
jgi:hypothetical protein